ncbi:PRTRC system protein F [Paraburkholderia sp. RL17-337-BIB-A]|uniref:PRTRC system protein F n=1 Tax=Paraburkholderia sp. RL17-337-BIB-A TaxID=3031636 RepID=UPI0038B7829C
MFFDPRPAGSEVAEAGERWQPARIAAARHRPPNDFLTLPAFDASVTTQAVMHWGASPSHAALVASHFDAGALRARDMDAFQSAGQALASGFAGFINRHQARWLRLNVNFVLCDVEAIREQIQYSCNSDEFEPTSSLYLGLEVGDERLYEFGARVHEMRLVHPRLVSTVMTLINRAAGRTVWVRTPDEFLGMFAQWFWDGDPTSSDEDVAKELSERFGDDKDETAHYLPSTVRPELCPSDMDVGAWSPTRRRFVLNHALGLASLRRLQRFHTGWVRRLCLELEELTLLLRRAGSRSLFDWGYRPESIYPACSLINEDCEHISELLDSHYEYFNSGSDGSLFLGFVPLAETPDEIRKQYADWTLGFSILNCLDRVTALVTP